MYVLFESSSGYALFLHTGESNVDSTDLERFSKGVKLVAFAPFLSAQHALENINAVSDGACHQYLAAFLDQNVNKKETVAMADPKLANAVMESCKSIKATVSDTANHVLRGVRNFLPRFLSALSPEDVVRAQLGLAHSYSRSKVKFNVHRSDNMIIQAVALLDQLDKDVNTFAMRVKEWYGWHFPELGKVVTDNLMFAKLAKRLGNKSSVSEKDLPDMAEILSDDSLAKDVLNAARVSMGTDLSEIDMANINRFADRVIALVKYRTSLADYLHNKMSVVAPNLSHIVGDVVGARLISHAGSLTNLAKAPASTIQILGAEKALFRALKTKGKTPKYGLLFHSSFIGKAKPRDKGRISRYVANKCAMASRIDAFSDNPTCVFGDALRAQVEDRLKFYESGEAPKKNLDVMHEATVLAQREAAALVPAAAEGSAKKRRREPEAESAEIEETPAAKKDKKKDKKKSDGDDSGKSDGMKADKEERKSKKSKNSDEEGKSSKKERKEKK